MSEDRLAFEASTQSVDRNSRAARRRQSTVTRRMTWPMIGFLFGFNLLPISEQISDAQALLLVSLGVGGIYALIFEIAALVSEPWLGQTKTALPYAQDWKAGTIFSLSMLAVVALKFMLARGGLPLAIGIIPIAVVARGNRSVRSKRNDVQPATTSGPSGDDRTQQAFDVGNPAHRPAMLQRAITIMNDERVSPETREKAARVARHITALSRPPKQTLQSRTGPMMKLPRLSTYVGPTIAALLWCGLFAVRAHLASARIVECEDRIYSGGAQLEICIRNAIETRDQAIMLACAGPVIAIIAVIIYRQYKAAAIR